MLEITFGDIADGWAKTNFDFDHENLTVDISYECDPFRDLADLAVRLMREESPLEMRFTDEEFNFVLCCKLLSDKCHITLECDGLSNVERHRPPQCFTCEADPREFARMLKRELARMSRDPKARNFWQTQDSEDRFHWHYPDDKVAELEKALME